MSNTTPLEVAQLLKDAYYYLSTERFNKFLALILEELQEETDPTLKEND